MMPSVRSRLSGLALAALMSVVPGFAADGEGSEAASRATIFIAGDSTAQAGNPNAVGWGKAFADYFDPEHVTIANHAIGGRSSRTFITEGRWDRLVEQVKPGDFVLIQFGHNDGGPIDRNPARGSIPGLGEETQEITHPRAGTAETVLTFGSYMRKMIAETRAKGAMPVLMSLTVRNYWNDGKVERGSGRYGEWARMLAESEKVPFIDHNKLIADHYEQVGRVAVNAFFPRDHVHTGEDGARLNAYLAVSGLKGLREQSIAQTLSLSGRMVPTAEPTNVYLPPQPPPRGGDRAAFLEWLNLPQAPDPSLPTVYLIGDSTVRNGRGNGYDGQFGWGDPFERYFYPAKTNLVNLAVGGTGARTFMTSYWPGIQSKLKEGDVVMIQFGHNDNGARGALPGVGEETEERETPNGEKVQVRSFGAYLRQYVADIRAAGATPVICSLVPRNRWEDGRIVRPANSHADWARSVAASEEVAFVDLHELIATHYDSLGQQAVSALFADSVHTNWEGAEINAQIVADGLRGLERNPLGMHLRPGM